MSGLLDLMSGRQPLGRALWVHALLYGTLLNLVATLAGLAVLAGGLPAWAAAAVFFLPIPYVALAVIGVWRSARRAPAARASTARLVVALWAVVMILV